MNNIFVKANKLINFISIFLILNSQIWKFCRFNFLLRCVLVCLQKSEANRKKLCQTPRLMVNFRFVLKEVSFWVFSYSVRKLKSFECYVECRIVARGHIYGYRRCINCFNAGGGKTHQLRITPLHYYSLQGRTCLCCAFANFILARQGCIQYIL